MIVKPFCVEVEHVHLGKTTRTAMTVDAESFDKAVTKVMKNFPPDSRLMSVMFEMGSEFEDGTDIPLFPDLITIV